MRCTVLGDMKLADYLKDTETTQVAFAEKIDRTHATVSRIAAGKQSPDPKTMYLIVDASDGVVTRADLRPDLYPEEAAA